MRRCCLHRLLNVTCGLSVVIDTTLLKDWLNESWFVYSWIAGQVYARKKMNLPANQKGYDNSKTTVGKLSARGIRFCPVHFCLGIILKVILNNFQNNT